MLFRWLEWRALNRFVAPWLARTFPWLFGWLYPRNYTPGWVREAERRDHEEGW